jgi:secreted trypsin-like serine protease
MKTRLALLVAMVFTVAIASLAGSAAAITGGTVDGNRHPEVGAMLADFGDGLDILCTGTLISPRVFLTASHCTDYLRQVGIGRHDVYVTFDPAWDPAHPGTAYRGTYFQNDLYGKGGQNDPHDIAVIVLDAAVTGITPAQLPTEGLLDRLPLRSATFTAVGYGTVRDVKTTGPHALYFDGIRRWVTQGFLSLQPAWLLLSMNFSTGNGGTCYGDSGGPHFYGGPDSNKLVATTITGDAVCVATDKDYRLDTPSAVSFLSQFATDYGPFTYWNG